MNTIKNSEDLLESGRKLGLEVRAEKDNHIIVSLHQNAGYSHKLLVLYESYENMEKIKYFGTTITIKVTLTRKLRKAYIREMLTTISFGVLSFPYPL
jgi:hypothetical protein